ncbi:diguanylate cyclase [Spirulina subsalsa FACHB-351]|uniref:Diguanylate cyclase n=1 Tax=Spirulina subsalsa FACHB-351 TaxID=234711 RepID=A0ABT3L3M1_9CYAN|nr:diguanylate cyclase [Spirulina subsalsa]MCW6036109.1 diguanylate cyclase [Spirulina subsalsa FACHB-351]
MTQTRRLIEPSPKADFLPHHHNILVVDDTPANLNLLTRILGNEGYKVRVAPNGKMAIRSALSNPPDLILLDIKIPDLDGYSICQRLKAEPQTCDVPILFISALDAVIDKIMAFSVGGVDYITKPFEPMEVLARIEHQLRLRYFQLQLEHQNQQLQLLFDTSQAIAQAQDVSTAFEAILTRICETLDWDYGEAWTLNSDQSHWIYSQAYYCPNPVAEDWLVLRQNLAFATGQGFIGKAAASREMIWFNAVSHESCPDYPICSQLLEFENFRNGLALPICLGEDVLAVLMFFHQTPPINSPNPKGEQQIRQLLKVVATQLGEMLQRKKAETALQEANRELERLATHDGLTKIANRRHFDQYLQDIWLETQEKGEYLSLILWDLDHFKQYNDCYGHPAGDRCLYEVSQAASRVVHRKTDLLARYGGEEFAVILPNTPIQGAIAVAQGIQQAIYQLQIPHKTSSVRPYITLSLGIASLIPQAGYSPQELIQLADLALYQAKNSGRDRWCYEALPTQLRQRGGVSC